MNGISVSSAGPLADSTQTRATNVRWRIFALILAYSFMSWFNRVSMSVAGDEWIMKSYNISTTDMGVVYSALLFTYALFMTPGGWFIDRFGPWVALAIMGLGSGLFGIMTGVVGWIFFSGGMLLYGLIAVRALMGFFTAPIYPACGQVIANWLPFHQRAWANGLVMGAALLGISSTFVVFGSLIDWLGWQAAFLVSGSVTVSLALAWTVYATNHPAQHSHVNLEERKIILEEKAEFLVSLPHPPSASIEPGAIVEGGGNRPYSIGPTKADWRSLFKNRSLVLLTASYAAIGYFEYLFYFWMHHYFDEQLHVGKEMSRLYATVVNLAMAVGMFSGGWISDKCIYRYGYRLGRAMVPVAGMIASAVFLILGLFATHEIAIVILFSCALASVGACEGPLWATAIDLGGKRGGTSAGIFNTGGNLGGIVAPVLTPAVSEVYGWEVGISLGAIFCLIGVILWIWIDPSERCAEDVQN
jgi:sugar phosphate permease